LPPANPDQGRDWTHPEHGRPSRIASLSQGAKAKSACSRERYYAGSVERMCGRGQGEGGRPNPNPVPTREGVTEQMQTPSTLLGP